MEPLYSASKSLGSFLALVCFDLAPSSIFSRPDGTADYDVWVGINHHMIRKGSVNGHVRSDGGAKLLRLIADRMDKDNA